MYEVIGQDSKNNDDAPDDLASMVVAVAEMIPWKIIVFVFIGYILLNTTTFVDRILRSWSGAVDGRIATEKGVVIQAMLLALGVMLFSIFINADCL